MTKAKPRKITSPKQIKKKKAPGKRASTPNVSKKKKKVSPTKKSQKKSTKGSQTSQLEMRLRYDKALAACAHELLANPDSSPQPIQNSIKHLLKAAEVSRVYIFECFQNDEDGICIRQTDEAVARGIKPEIDNPDLQHFPLNQAGFQRWVKALSNGRHIGGSVARFPKSERAILEPQDILSILVLPIFVDRQWYGLIGFDDCVHNRAWSRDDIRMLKAASEIIGGYLSQQKMQTILRKTQARLEVQLKEQRASLKSAHADLDQEVGKRKRSAVALKESEERFRQLAANVSEILWFTSIDGKRVIYVNPAFETIFGAKVEELYEKPDLWLDFVHPQDKDNVLNSFTEESLITGAFDIEFRIIRRDGLRRWIKTRGLPIRNSQGKVYRIAGIATDITDEKEIKSQLMESQERFRSLVDQATDAFFVHDSEGRIYDVNPKACEVLGYTREELLRIPISDIEVSLPVDEISKGLRNLQPGESVTFEGLHRRRNQSTFPVEVSLGPINWKGSQYLFATARNITQRKQVELELIKTKEAAEQASEAKSEFLSRVSHELRTPLNAILGFGQLLESYSNQPLSQMQNTQVSEIMKAGRHLLELINDVLDLSNIESGRMALKIETVPLKHLLEETMGLVETMAIEKGITIDQNISSIGDLTVSGDRTRLKQVFLNLLTNAIKYNQNQGSVNIGVESIDKHQLRVFIEDTGLGIPPDKLEAIFEPFQRLELGPAPVPGTGMGLSIVQNLLSLMEGTIEVSSDGEKGSRFIVSLRRSITEDVAIPRSTPISFEQSAPKPDNKVYRVLYIEDNRSNMMLVQQILQARPKIKLLTSDHPKAGIRLALQERPDLILLDINLPEMDGFGVMKVLQGHEETRDTPVIAVSAHAMRGDIDKALAMGFVHYLPKPIEVLTLLSHIDSILAVDTP